MSTTGLNLNHNAARRLLYNYGWDHKLPCATPHRVCQIMGALSLSPNCAVAIDVVKVAHGHLMGLNEAEVPPMLYTAAKAVGCIQRFQQSVLRRTTVR
jgi:hypothetical protein